MLVECTNCGAPLDVKPGAFFAQCTYCNRVNRVRKMPTVAMRTPPSWQPPPVWMPPPHLPALSQPLEYHQGANKVVIWIIILSTALPVVLVGVVIAIGALASQASVSSSREVPQPDRPAEQPATPPSKRSRPQAGGVALQHGQQVVCSGNKRVTVTRRAIRPPGGAAVMATGNCHVTLDHCSVSGSPAIVVSDSARVIVRGGTVETTGPIAIVANGSGALVQLRDGAQLSGGVMATNGARVER